MISVKDLQLSEKLSSNNIRKLLKDPYGFTWIATQDGLSRFDGKEVVIIKNNNSYYGALPELDVRDLVLDTISKVIWIVQPASLTAINYQNLKITVSVPLASFGTDDWNMKAVLVNRLLWITSYYGLKKFDTKSNESKLVFKSEAKSKDIIQINQIYHGPENTLWTVFNKDVIYIVNSTTTKIDTLSTGDFSKVKTEKLRLQSLLFASKNTVIAGTTSGLYKIQYDTDKKKYIVKQDEVNATLSSDTILTLIQYNTNHLIAVTSKKILEIPTQTNTAVRQYCFSQRDINKWITSFYDLIQVDKNELLIAASTGIGVIRLGQSLFNAFVSNEAISEKGHVNCVFSVPGGILTGTKSGLYLVNEETKEKATLESSDYYYHIFRGPSDRVLVSGQRQLYCYFKGKLNAAGNEFPELKMYQNVSVISTAERGDSVIILASENGNGLLIWNYKKQTVEVINKNSIPVSLNTDLINRVFITQKKEMVIISDFMINTIDENLKTAREFSIQDAKTKKPYGICFDIAEDNSNFWMAVYGTGLVKLTKDFKVVQEYGANDNLNNTGVYKVFDRDSVLWVTTNNGLSILDKQTGKFKNYYKTDGLHSSSFEEGSGLAFKDKIIAGGAGGFSVIQPQFYKAYSISSKVYINGYSLYYANKVTDTFSLQSNTIVFEAYAQQLILHLAIPIYADQERIRYYYRIRGLQNQWTINATQNIISIYKIEPGTYDIEVKASLDGYDFSPSSVYKLIVKPKWYQTWWFYLLVVLTIAAILYALYRYRISQIKKQHEIRKNIATDLHDDLGSTLNSVKVFTNLAISGVKQEESLQQVKDNLTEATMSLRDMIWVLDDSLDTVDELVTRLKQFAIPVTAASNIEFVINADSEVNNRQLTKEEKRNLFLICKEAINNSIKYSGGTQIQVDIKPAGKKIQIAIADNGKGFDEATVRKGYGLKNMQYRAGQVKYSVLLNSAYDKGTSVFIKPV